MTIGHDATRCGGPALCQECAQAAATEAFNASQGQGRQEVTCPNCGHRFVPDAPIRATEAAAPSAPASTAETVAAVEALVNGRMSFSDIGDAVQSALRQRLAAEHQGRYAWVGLVDLTASDVVYAPHVDGQDRTGLPTLNECSYSITETGEVTLGTPRQVVRSYAPAPASADDGDGDGGQAATESERVRHFGRVVEALDDDPDGGRVFRVRILAYGTSRNGRRYTESVMSEAAPMYEGARAYDHHRTAEEMQSSTIAGLVGYYRDVEAEADGLYGDLHLLPSAVHAAEALDATLAAQERGLPPLLGVSHDVMAHYRPVMSGGRRVQEATAIARVHSADLVADPAAGGQATRMVAGGTDDPTTTGTQPDDTQEDDVPPTPKDVLAALREATADDLASVGLVRAPEADPPTTPPAPAPTPATENEQGGQQGERATESTPKTGWLAAAMIRAKVSDAGLPEAVTESLTEALPDRITEADVDRSIAALKATLGTIERAGLAPTTGNVQVTQEARDKKIAALDSFFAGNFVEGYRSFRQAWSDFTGHRPGAWDEDIAKRIMRESVGSYDSGDRLVRDGDAVRLREAMDTATWNLVLGDSITRRMVAEYARPDLGTWRQIVSSIVPVNDFRTQRIDRIGGYGLLPSVPEGAPYQPLTSPPNEEANYQLGKKGGTESITFEMIANDDIRAISRIPAKLGLSASLTLYRFVWDFLVFNAATSYDATALFHANHNNTGSSALSHSALSTVRAAMRRQASYGDAVDILSIVPQTLVVPAGLEDLAWQIATSAVAIPGSGSSSDLPNIHNRMNPPVVIDYWTDPNDWFTIADPSRVPTIEIGFYGGRQDPELWTQSDPSIGSMFDADKITYKLRHIYGGTVLDHRGFYRNVVA
ncbi:hypothetical protein [Actinomadura flavalba]|uniref:phage major capsid protein n=1 Tax=Actinomadura flavalba TaxID=1120938 RepID=UPI00036FC300|nr:hypothetical protein [Actinomadura flavalba]